MEKEVFDAVSSYIIPKPELKDRLITITTRDYKVVGCPVCMEVWPGFMVVTGMSNRRC